MSDIENIYYEVFEGRSIKIKPKKKSNIIIQQGGGEKKILKVPHIALL